MKPRFPDAQYVVLASRLIPGLDGGFTIATLARARHMAGAGVGGGRGPLLLTLDPGSLDAHTAHRREFEASGEITSADVMRNLFDDAAADPSWLCAAAVPGEATKGIEYRMLRDAAGAPLLSLPVITGDPHWHLSAANVVVHCPGGDRVLAGFGALYRAWLTHLIEQCGANEQRPMVIVCEGRQVGELLAGWEHPHVRIVHTIHTSHREVSAPSTAATQLWRRWFALVDRFDAVLWPTAQQKDDVEAMLGARANFFIVPSAGPAAVAAAAEPVPGRVVMLNRLAPGKRVDLAIRLWRRVVAEVPNAQLHIYGDGPERERLTALIGELGLSSCVVLHGHTDLGAAVFDDAEVMLQTTAYEGQGLSALEAMSRGCPVVSFDVRYGPHDQLSSGGGVLVPDGDKVALAAEVIRILRDRVLRDRLSTEALERARAFDATHTMTAMAEAVRHALADPVRSVAAPRV